MEKKSKLFLFVRKLLVLNAKKTKERLTVHGEGIIGLIVISLEL